ncbi:hypothetical protein [Mycolicibacterium tokaiense]|uniref:Uncharacterized protein n=1 Tax=Mycolicibacterium tokaiense TaxID=39695 RepID=A0A378THM7_9MYCO|nr:hypothetical protein [Mycolicibacterium tokaiense]BBY85819.1 hypothetical protein MTOK_16010 [Mycolicibacterium tokaiense]STZ59667.1 Uncharacterised protein [Mycolicibacterium tokaiense]
MALDVTIEDLAASGVAVTGHGEEVATKHCAADSRMESARGGWQGQEFWSMEERHAEALKVREQQADTIAARM